MGGGREERMERKRPGVIEERQIEKHRNKREERKEKQIKLEWQRKESGSTHTLGWQSGASKKCVKWL